MFFVYIIQSKTNFSYYIGYSGNLERRLIYHNSGRSRYTSKNTPWKLIYFEKFDSKSDAIKREIFIKRQKSRVFIEELIANSTIENYNI
ncbi:GIY-YIG nuclease family protein [Paralabilibaculum antarcticum]|uniref:GIY-YIG nuclease family protein n=1 Tax=Paralabilibaculum antarcticum TaxID=2912572 RepID=UPI003CCC04A5